MFRKLATAVAITIAMAGSAQAAFVSYNSGPLLLETADIFQNLSLQQFDSSLGTLNSATFLFQGQVVSSLTLTNVAAQTNRFGYTSQSTFSLTGTGGVNQSLLIPLFNFPITSVAVGETVNVGTVDLTDVMSFTATDLAAFTGAGMSTFTCETSTSQNTLGGGGNVDNKQRTNAGCYVSVRYDYTEAVVTTNSVPEPGSLALMGAAGLSAVFAARRRRRS